MTNTVQEPFSRVLPQHVLIRPPCLSEAHISEAVQVEKTAHHAGHVTVPETCSRSAGKTEKFVMGPIALLATVLLLALRSHNSDMAVHLSGQQYPNLSVHQTGGA
jgi:hypothetical protein